MRVWSLVKGVIELSHMFQKHISNLMIELRELNESIKIKKFKPKSTIPTIQMSFIHQRVHWKTDLQSMQLLLQHHWKINWFATIINGSPFVKDIKSMFLSSHPEIAYTSSWYNTSIDKTWKCSMKWIVGFRFIVKKAKQMSQRAWRNTR